MNIFFCKSTQKKKKKKKKKCGENLFRNKTKRSAFLENRRHVFLDVEKYCKNTNIYRAKFTH